jgi:hypothetical protein
VREASQNALRLTFWACDQQASKVLWKNGNRSNIRGDSQTKPVPTWIGRDRA